IHPYKPDSRDGLVRPLHRVFQICGPRSNAQNAASGGEVNVIAVAGRGVKNLDALELSRPFQTCNFFPGLERARVAAGSNHHTNRGVGSPAENVIVYKSPFHRSLEGIEQVAFEAHQDGLRLRVAEAAVELEH